MREFTGVSYHRQSKISEQIDAEKTPAELANGVLFGRFQKRNRPNRKRLKSELNFLPLGSPRQKPGAVFLRSAAANASATSIAAETLVA